MKEQFTFLHLEYGCMSGRYPRAHSFLDRDFMNVLKISLGKLRQLISYIRLGVVNFATFAFCLAGEI